MQNQKHQGRTVRAKPLRAQQNAQKRAFRAIWARIAERATKCPDGSKTAQNAK